jgi:uncharacterized phosphosugar-binding protein
MSCTCTVGAPAGQVAFTIDGSQYYVAPGTYTTAQIVLANSLNNNIVGLKSTVNTQPVFLAGVVFTIAGGESFVSQYGPF